MRFLCFLFILLTNKIWGQTAFYYTFDDSIKVFSAGLPLKNAWAGGLNAPQFSTIDLNGDLLDDLVAFDRFNNKVYTFINLQNAWHYAPAYENLFPEGLRYWVLLVDYDRDGKKDLFAASDFGIRVFRNAGFQSGKLTWKLFKNPLQTKGITGSLLRLQIDATDIPALIDVDNDGDLDILNFIAPTGSEMEWNKNLSMERYQRPDSLDFERTDLRWGNFSKCHHCTLLAFGQNSCRNEHSGSTSTLLDLDGDNDLDALIGDVGCDNLTALFNNGTPQKPNFNNFAGNYPIAKPATFPTFLASFYEDVNFDTVKDLLVCPNVLFNEGNVINFDKSAWLYKNINTTQKPDFQFVIENFLQNEMLDFGEHTRPIVLDIDADNDLDVLVSNAGLNQKANDFRASIFLLENNGTNENPIFALKNNNFLDFLSLNVRNLKITSSDLDANGAADLAFTATSNQDQKTRLFYVLNTATKQEKPIFNLDNKREIVLSEGLFPLDEPLFVNIDADKEMELFIARLQGGLWLYENTENLTFSLKTKDFGGLEDDILTRQLSIAVHDLNNNGKLDLMTGDKSGTLNLYMDFNEKLIPENDFIFNSLTNSKLAHHFGGISPIFMGNNILVGTANGGLQFLRFQRGEPLQKNDKTLGETFDFQVFPNPVTDNFYIKSTEKGKVEISNVLGELIFAGVVVANENLYVPFLKQSGVYLVVFTPDDKRIMPKTKKIVR